MKTFRRLIPYFLSVTLAITFVLTAALAADPSTDATSASAKKKKKKRTSKSPAAAGTAAKSATVNKSATPAKPKPAVVTSTGKAAVATKASSTTGTAVSTRTTTTSKRRVRKYYNPWDEPTYKDSTEGDSVDGEDLEVRRAAVEALGPYNGSIVVVDPNTGRILTMVNQRLALGGGFQPCSTIKVSVALAALHEGIVKQNTLVRLTSRYHMDLTEALAHSNNYYFANLGVKLGYEKVSFYAHEFGYGEKAGLNIEGEHPGYFPPAPPANGGMGMLTSFGEEIAQTPLELAALMSSVANGGTLYWLQYPENQDAVKNFVPQVKRNLDIQPYIELIKPGLKGAVDFGTAKRARQDDIIMGKTGTCSQSPAGKTHLGWFGSFNESGSRKLVVVVLLTGGRPSIGPMAASVAGDVYRNLAQQKYFLSKDKAGFDPTSLISTHICCAK
jgi:cell division protein FtsI/penicillin-binding protein 2